MDLLDGVWIKDGYYWRKLNYGKASFGDLIFNTCYKIYREGDRSDWAYNAMCSCYCLIQERKRWPNRMKDETCVNTWLARIIFRAINKLLKRNVLPYRYQGRMVRDIYTAFAPVAIMLDAHELLKDIKVAWYVNTPPFKYWWRYVVTLDDMWLLKYRFWQNFTHPKKDYVIRLNEIREETINLLKGER